MATGIYPTISDVAERLALPDPSPNGLPYTISVATHFVLPRADVGQGRHALVKEAAFFKSQRGLEEDWGRNWVPVQAEGLAHARLLGWFIGSGTEHPSAISFTPPNRRTVGELLTQASAAK
jgi:hypothetical protein